MASPERNISTGTPFGARQPSVLDERLASLEDEATHLRAEVAALQDEIRWLTGEDEEPPGWLARGWVRASLLLTAVGMVALVSLPYLLHLDASSPHDPTPSASSRPAPAAPRATVAPARILPVDAHPDAAPRPRPARERRTVQPSDAAVAAPVRGESP
jgi:hypothetical protein